MFHFYGALGITRSTTHDLPYAIGKVGWFVLKPPQEILFFLFPGTLGTARPTFLIRGRLFNRCRSDFSGES